ncbi:hypothetical protein V8G54_000417 [Vigna mungo]|uniref:Uncharacterized protein n=1 Tax=Vigna mungo TaxID=3915 RepID=A0AAQ3S9Y1_VIGMU
MRIHGLHAAEIRESPYLQSPVPRNRVDGTVSNCQPRDGVCMLDPELFVMATDSYIVLREEETVETVFDSGESGEDAVVGLVVSPDADLGVLVGGEDEVVGEGDGFGGVGSGLDVESVEDGAGVTVVDIDFVVRCGVEEVVGDGEGSDRARGVWGERVDAVVGDGEGDRGLVLERGNGWKGLYGEVGFERGNGGVRYGGRGCFGNERGGCGGVVCMLLLFKEGDCGVVGGGGSVGRARTCLQP